MVLWTGPVRMVAQAFHSARQARPESPRTPGTVPHRVGGRGRWSMWVVGGPAWASRGTGSGGWGPLVDVGGQVGGGGGVEVGCGAAGRFGGMAGGLMVDRRRRSLRTALVGEALR